MENSCAVIYGKLPPETRKDQAKKFNDPFSNFKYLIATNAVCLLFCFLNEFEDWNGSQS